MGSRIWLGPDSAVAQWLVDWFYNSPDAQFVMTFLMIFALLAIGVLLVFAIPLRLIVALLSSKPDRYSRAGRFIALVLSLMLGGLFVLGWRENLLASGVWPYLLPTVLAIAACAAIVNARFKGLRLLAGSLIPAALAVALTCALGYALGNGVLWPRLAGLALCTAVLTFLGAFKLSWRRSLSLLLSTAALFALGASAVKPSCTLDPLSAQMPPGARWEVLTELPAYGMALSADGRLLYYSLKHRTMPGLYRIDRQNGEIENYQPEVGSWIVRLEVNPIDGLVYSNGNPTPLVFSQQPLSIVRMFNLPDSFSGRRYNHILLDPEGGRLYASARMPGTIVGCNLDDFESFVSRTYENQLVAPASMAWGPDRTSLYVVENRRGYFPGFHIAEIDPETLEIRRRALIGPYNYGLAIDPQRNIAYVGQLLNGLVSIDLETLQIINVFRHSGIREVAFDPITDRVYAADFFNGRTYALDPDSLEKIGELRCGCETRGLLPDGQGNLLISSRYGVLFAPADAFE
ncbi:MAG: YncE family protein [Candidatus Alcyoniella australis]|nr:YncE family protein [Candidatus Alcyoniella australis]